LIPDTQHVSLLPKRNQIGLIKRHVKDAFIRQANDEGHVSRSY
jgi:hypothetical protein